MKQLNQYIVEKLRISANDGFGAGNSNYFYHEALEDGYSTEFTRTYSSNILQYSIDNCNTWEELEPDTETPKINKGQRIYFKCENMKVDRDNGIGLFKSNKKFNAGGNIMSLIYDDDFDNKFELTKSNIFRGLFSKNEFLVSAKYLVLPANELSYNCYTEMFYCCKSLIEAPEVLPANKLSESCYSDMLNGCISLIAAPKLPAKILAKECYERMFQKCTSLTKAPELSAETFVDFCYNSMFKECSTLKEITMLATDISGRHCLLDWIKGVSKTGTFIKAKGVDLSIASKYNDYKGIPEGWTVKEI